MRISDPIAFVCGLSLLSVPAFAAPAKVQFSRQVLPLLNKECGSCHTGPAAPGGFSIESQNRLFAGGRHGAAVVPGKSAASTIVKYVTGELKPTMPPNKPLALDQIATIRRWIDEGAKVDSMVAPTEKGGILRGAMPLKMGVKAPAVAAPSHSHTALPTAVSQAAPVTAMAYSPDGKWLAVGGYRVVRLLNPADGTVAETLSGPSDQVLSVAWSADGKWLAGAGGISGSFGEVCLWDVPAAGSWQKPRVLKEHSDAIYSIAWRKGAPEFATGSIDKTVRVWDAAAGKVKRVLKDHVDAVSGVAYSPDGKWLGTGSMDRTVKLYNAETDAKTTSLQNGDGVTAVAFGPKSDIVVAACADKQVKVWPVKAGTVENPLRNHGEGEAVDAMAFSADGSVFVWGAINRKVRIWNPDVSSQRREMNDCADWVYSVAASPDGKTIAAGGADGKVYFWNAQDGKLLRSVAVGGVKLAEKK